MLKDIGINTLKKYLSATDELMEGGSLSDENKEEITKIK
jgi:hypothetical protein